MWCFSCQSTSSASFLHSVKPDLCCFRQMQKWWHASRSPWYTKCLLLAKAILFPVYHTADWPPSVQCSSSFIILRKEKAWIFSRNKGGCTLSSKCHRNITSNNLISEVKPFSWMSSRIKCHDESSLIWFNLTAGTHEIDFSPFGDGIFWLKFL